MIAVLVLTALYVAATWAAGRLKFLRGAAPHWRTYMFCGWVLAFGIGFLSPPVWLLVLLGLLGYAAGAAINELRKRNLYFHEQGIQIP